MLLCQDVVIDEDRETISVIGIFEDVHSDRFPVKLRRIFVYSELTEGRGSMTVLLRFFRRTADDLDGEEITSFGANVTFPSPRYLERFIVEVPGLELIQPGEYRAILYANGKYLAERRLSAHIS